LAAERSWCREQKIRSGETPHATPRKLFVCGIGVHHRWTCGATGIAARSRNDPEVPPTARSNSARTSDPSASDAFCRPDPEKLLSSPAGELNVPPPNRIHFRLEPRSLLLAGALSPARRRRPPRFSVRSTISRTAARALPTIAVSASQLPEISGAVVIPSAGPFRLGGFGTLKQP